MQNRTKLFLASGLPLCLLVAACGGGGGGGTRPPPIAPPPVTPPPPPTPLPPPPPPPDTGFDTAEFTRSQGIGHANAITAYENGATGSGVTVAVVDSGIDQTSPEFAGRISPASRDLDSNRTIQDIGGHGTAVSAIIGAARNNSGIVGIAFDSTILALRTDEPGSCENADPDETCSHPTINIARAIDAATQANARVINISLGGSPPTQAMRDAVARAANAGIVVVIAAGNDSEANPDPLANIAFDASARGQVIIAGSVNLDDTLSEFSNRAGNGREFYLAALGNRVRSFDNTGAAFLFSGTSFSTPQIAGAVALLAQAFPNLTGRQIIDLLYASARDAGAAGTDAVFGHGILDLAEAFQPQGQSTLAGTSAPISFAGINATLSAPMGDARQTGTGAVILDGFDRAFAVDLAATVQRTPAPRALANALDSRRGGSFATAAGSNAILAFTIDASTSQTGFSRLSLRGEDAERARVAAGMVAGRIDPNTTAAFAFSQSGESVGARLNGRERPAFLVARDAAGQSGFATRPETSFALHRRFGDMGVTVFGETGDSLSREDLDRSLIDEQYRRSDYAAAGFALNHEWGGLRFDAGVSTLSETRTFLGARFSNALGGNGGARSLFLDSGVGYGTDNGWRFAADFRHGWTFANGANATLQGGEVRSFAASADISKSGVMTVDDWLSFRVAQPLRVYSGGLNLSLPTGYDYATLGTSYGDSFFNLAPSGRQIDLETAYSTPFGGGFLTGNLFYRRDPGNFDSVPDDIGAAVRFTLGF